MNVELEELIGRIEALDTAAMAECHKQLSELEEPVETNLGFLAERIAGVRRTVHPDPLKKVVVIFAADHAVDGGENMTKGKNSLAEAMQVAQGKGTINKVAHRIGAGVLLADMGLQQELPESEGVQNARVMAGSRFFGKGAAMTKDEMDEAMMYGARLAQQLADEGYTAAGLGNIGERGLLSAFAVTAAFFRDKLEELPGNIGDRDKIEKLSALMERLDLDRKKPMQLLRYAGGPDIAAMVGFVLSAAQRRMLIVFDNAVTGAAVLLARTVTHAVDSYIYPSARYAEPVHQMQMKKLGMKPFLQYDVEGDQGMGSVLGLSLLDAAVRMMDEKLKA